MITLNNTEQRQYVKPLTSKQLNDTIKYINDTKKYCAVKLNNQGEPLTQRLIDSYQNLQHFWDVVGGWEGLEKGIQDAFIKGVEAGKCIE